MFKISIVDTPGRRRLVVEGKLIEPWIAELGKAWNLAAEGLDGMTRVIDLSSITVMSQEGENAILELISQGARFSCEGVLMKHVLQQLTYRCPHTSEGVQPKPSESLKLKARRRERGEL